MAGSILGNRVLRKEDPKFLTTGGVYVDDLRDEPLLVGAVHATFVRSTVAHANITWPYQPWIPYLRGSQHG